MVIVLIADIGNHIKEISMIEDIALGTVVIIGHLNAKDA